MATIGDVAVKAHVSTATVSRVLNGKSSVDPDLVQRVKWAARELSYQPNGPARSLRKRSTAMIALIISDVQSPFFTSLARGVEDVAHRRGYSVVLCNADDDLDKERHYVDVASQELAAGVVLCPTNDATDVRMLVDRGTPVVSVDRPMRDPRCDQVLVDIRSAAAEATEHLLNEEYRRIGCITGPAGRHPTEQLLAGYREALAAHGCDHQGEFVRYAPDRADAAAKAAADLLDRLNRPDALLIGTTTMAIGALAALSARQLRPGKDVGIVAFDNAPWTTLLDPALSVIDQPAYDLGVTAAECLLAKLNGAPSDGKTVVLPAKLIKRGSSSKGLTRAHAPARPC